MRIDCNLHLDVLLKLKRCESKEKEKESYEN